MSFKEDLAKQNDETIIEIANYLLTRDDLIDALNKPNKSLKEMYEYVYSELKKKYEQKKGRVSGSMPVPDKVVFELAVHYYDEDDIKVEKIEPQASVKTSVSKKADKPKTKKKNNVHEGQMTLFDE